MVCFTTPSKVLMMFRFMETIAFYTLGSLNSLWECCMPPFSAVLVQMYSGIYIHTSDSHYIAPYIKTPIYEAFSLTSALNISNIKPNNSHIWLWGNFNYMWFQDQYNIFEYMVILDNVLYHNWYDECVSILYKVWNIYDFKICLWLW